MDNIKQVTSIIRKLTESEILEKDMNLSVYGLDSLRRVELVILLEEQFAISFDDADLTQSNFETINSIEKLLQKYGVHDG